LISENKRLYRRNVGGNNKGQKETDGNGTEIVGNRNGNDLNYIRLPDFYLQFFSIDRRSDYGRHNQQQRSNKYKKQKNETKKELTEEEELKIIERRELNIKLRKEVLLNRIQQKAAEPNNATIPQNENQQTPQA
jgi:hypothetical protein